jgi:hypothetical protein
MAYSRSTFKKSVGETHFKHMERLKLNVLALIPEQIHHHLEISLVRDVFSHHIEVGPI